MTASSVSAPPNANAGPVDKNNNQKKRKSSFLMKTLKQVGSSSKKLLSTSSTKDNTNKSLIQAASASVTTSSSNNSSSNNDNKNSSPKKPFFSEVIFMKDHKEEETSVLVHDDDDEVSIIPDDVDVDEVIDAQSHTPHEQQQQRRHSPIIDVDEIPKTILTQDLRNDIVSSPQTKKNKRGGLLLSSLMMDIDIPTTFQLLPPKTVFPFASTSSSSSSRQTTTTRRRWLWGVTAVAATAAFYVARPRSMGRT